MNYYEHHLGDYAAATAHLSWDEDMAYTRLLRAYYHHERGIQDGQQYRVARASTPGQRRAVDSVLGEFFTLVDRFYTQKRADGEIARFRDKARKASASANVRWAQSERNANASNHPAEISTADAMRTHSDGNAEAMRIECEGNARAPVPSPQSPDTKKVSASAAFPAAARVVGKNDPKHGNGVDADPVAGLAAAITAAGVPVDSFDPLLASLLANGMTEAELLAAAGRAKGRPWAWVVAAAEGKRADAAAVVLTTAMTATVLAPQYVPGPAPPPETEERRLRRQQLAGLRAAPRAVDPPVPSDDDLLAAARARVLQAKGGHSP